MRPGFTCTADITTATRKGVVAIPIQATTVRELVFDEKGNVVKEPEADKKKPQRPGAAAAPRELKPGQTKKETEGVFVIKDGKAAFLPVKTGIAGEKYLEVLSGVEGRRRGHRRAVQLGPRPEGRRRGEAAGRRQEVGTVGRIFEGVLIALRAIWSSKLRSFMSVLGNIVAVTSIIAVVSLIQGLNATVTDAIVSDVGADSFVVDRYGVTRSEEDFEKVRSNPRITLAGRRGDPEVTARSCGRSWPRAAGRARSPSRSNCSRASASGACRPEYVNFSSYNAERGRLLSPSEVERNRNVVLLGWGTADRLFGQAQPARQDHQDRGRPLPRDRRQREEGRRSSASRRTSSR